MIHLVLLILKRGCNPPLQDIRCSAKSFYPGCENFLPDVAWVVLSKAAKPLSQNTKKNVQISNEPRGQPCIDFACRGDGVPPVADGDLLAGALGDRRALPRARRSEEQNAASFIFSLDIRTADVFC